ncbi:hypothetical protein D3C80_950930 [compost metagenome]
MQQRRHFGRAGKHHSAYAVIRRQLRADGFATAWQKLHYAWRNAGFEQNVDPLGGNQWGLLGRFCQHAVTGGQRGGDLSGENGQREVPRADTDHRTERAVGFVIEIVAHLARIVMQEINRLAHFGNRVAEGFTRFAHQNADQLLHLAFHQDRGAFQNCGTLLRRCSKPDRRVIDGIFQRQLYLAFGGFTHKSDNIFRFGRVDNGLHFTGVHRLRKNRFGLPFLQRAVEQGRGERRQAVFVRQIQTRRVDAIFPVQLARQGDFRVREADLAFLCR